MMQTVRMFAVRRQSTPSGPPTAVTTGEYSMGADRGPVPPRVYVEGEVIPGSSLRIVRVLGEGGFGTVFEVEDEQLRVRRAAKVLHVHLARTFRRHMQQEWTTLARLDHHNIVAVLHAGFTSDAYELQYFVMPLLQGGSLRQLLIETATLRLERAIDIGIELLDALCAAHGVGVVHRDVKPANVFVERAGSRGWSVKLLDFGLSRSCGAAHSSTSSLLGTPAYTAPELFLYEPPSTASDLYAAGLVLYEMLVGAHPLAPTDNWAKAHLKGSYPALRQRCAVPEELSDLVDGMLLRDPRERRSNAARARDKLRTIRRRVSGYMTEPYELSTGSGLDAGMGNVTQPLDRYSEPVNRDTVVDLPRCADASVASVGF